ncbi:alcohol dehydrogenase [Penicillium antarcticum]|uniref:alcohol dehydrogenase n=1 Tax=Penicillium antarcticum TaxID=416450 RepID=UPI0023917415|nr:alcohol dehydrogenase [Penicillium antarcticum]KAJ5320060.1 alcohol dehydrogenase [Penicillium antarcticum]
MSNQSLALVAYGPISRGQWKLQHAIPRPIRPDEALVRLVASGVCRADIHIGDAATEGNTNPGIYYPRILGHEGSGFVEEVGSAVTSVKMNDPVITSFASCGECYNCDDDHPAYCIDGFEHNFVGEKEMYSASSNGDFDIAASFFGQSSFAKMAIVKARSLVNVSGLGVTNEELRLFAPLGCGIQTGAGAMTTIADVKPNQDVAILGVGGVGQSAIMAAAMRQCRTIIAIDHTRSRLELAKSLGATHTIQTSDPNIDLVAEVLKITGQRGVHVSLDTSGVQKLAKASWDFVRCLGKVLQVGLAKPLDKWDISMADHMNSGKQIIGCVQGDAIPQNYIREMIGWYKAGKLPVEKIVNFYPVEEYHRAFQDMEDGKTIKPILVWNDSCQSKI